MRVEIDTEEWLQKPSPEVFYKKVVLKILKNSQENTCVKVSFLI